MGLSETIVAAIIGALATMGTAIFQLIRNRAPSDGRPKPKKSRMRSVMATIALMIGCIVGGYAWSALRAVSAKEELRLTMQEEFTRQFTEFAARQNLPPAPTSGAEAAAALAASNGQAGSAESLAQLPPCRISAQTAEAGPVTCSESIAHTVALCAAVPAKSQTTNVRVQARVPKSESPWEERDAGAATLGSLHIAAATTETAVSPDLRAVCLDVANHSVQDELAVRLIVDYSFAPAATDGLTAAAPGAHSL
jgi:hypothetical protein